MDAHIPTTQAAYRRGRSTTEQVFTLKILVGKAITSTDYTAQLLLMDMSKAFDTGDRIKEDLGEILNPDELYIIKLMIEDVVLSVKIGNERGILSQPASAPRR